MPGWDDLANENVPTDLPLASPANTALSAPCTAYASWDTAHINGVIGIPLAVYSGVPTGCNGLVTDKVADTDVLVVGHASTCVAGEVNCESFDANKLYMNVANCLTQIEGGTPYALDPNEVVTMQEKDCDPSNLVPNRKFEQTIYYIRDHSVSGDGIPTLVRSEFDWDGSALVQGAVQALVEGIEGFRVEVGIDSETAAGLSVDYTSATAWLDPADRSIPTNRGNGVPDSPTFVHCPSETPACNVADFRDVVAVKMYLLARTTEPTLGYKHGKKYFLGSQELTPPDDGFKRQVYSSAIRLNNVAGRRETPYDPNSP